MARILACGAFLKNSACLFDTQAPQAPLWSAVHGDLSDPAACAALKQSVQDLLKMQQDIGTYEQQIATLREQMGEYKQRMDELHAQLVTLRAAVQGQGIEIKRHLAPRGSADPKAAAVGNATTRAIVFKNRDKDFLIYPDGRWEVGFLGGSHEFLKDGVVLMILQDRHLSVIGGV